MTIDPPLSALLIIILSFLLRFVIAFLSLNVSLDFVVVDFVELIFLSSEDVKA